MTATTIEETTPTFIDLDLFDDEFWLDHEQSRDDSADEEPEQRLRRLAGEINAYNLYLLWWAFLDRSQIDGKLPEPDKLSELTTQVEAVIDTVLGEDSAD
jgi:S-adenosylmethionine:diacylglycerol 3-amino-3-carboxypropyl transferase